MTGRCLEDFAVGQTFHAGPVPVHAERMKAFAAEFDPQPFHLDEHAARDTIFGELVASGWHTAAITMRLLVESDFRPAGGYRRRRFRGVPLGAPRTARGRAARRG